MLFSRRHASSLSQPPVLHVLPRSIDRVKPPLLPCVMAFACTKGDLTACQIKAPNSSGFVVCQSVV